MSKAKWIYGDLFQLSDCDINRYHRIQFQIQDMKNEKMSKRVSIFELAHMSEDLQKWWINKVNARTILPCELCLDYDPNKNWTKKQMVKALKRMDYEFKKYKQLYKIWEVKIYIFDSGGRGIHVHIFNPYLFHLNEQKRKSHRLEWFDRFILYKGEDDVIKPELLKISERVTINLEYSKHYKSGKLKKLLREI